jgi:hypothetical protein
MARRASLSDVYKAKNNREVVLNEFQAQVFENVIEQFKSQGVGGDDIFEDTYVLQKEIAQYITGNVTAGAGSTKGLALQTYNFILGIETMKSDPVVVAPESDDEEIDEIEEIEEEEVVREIKMGRPKSTMEKYGPKSNIRKNIKFRDMRDKIRTRRPKTMAEYLKNRGITRPTRPSTSPKRPAGKPRSFKSPVSTGGASPFKFDFQALRNRSKGGRGFSGLKGFGGMNFGGFGR